jgi:hypothetical protein
MNWRIEEKARPMRFCILWMLALAVLDGRNIKIGPAVGNPVPDFSAQD